MLLDYKSSKEVELLINGEIEIFDNDDLHRIAIEQAIRELYKSNEREPFYRAVALTMDGCSRDIDKVEAISLCVKNQEPVWIAININQPDGIYEQCIDFEDSLYSIPYSTLVQASKRKFYLFFFEPVRTTNDFKLISKGIAFIEPFEGEDYGTILE